MTEPISRVKNLFSRSKPRLFLHVGTHKTGTTAIQNFAEKNRVPLLDRGLWFPSFKDRKDQLSRDRLGSEHLRISHAIAGQHGTLDAKKTDKIVQLWRKQAVSARVDVFFSAEPIWRHIIGKPSQEGFETVRRRYLEAVAHLFRGFDVRVIAVIRDHDSFAQSSFAESINRANKLSLMLFEEFVEQQRGKSLEYYKNLDLMEQIFGCVNVLNYSDIKTGDGFIQNFYALMNVSTDGLASVGRVRESLSTQEAIIKKHLDTLGFDTDESFRKLTSDAIFVRTASDLLNNCETFWQSEPERQRFIDSFSADNEALRSRWFSDRERLFDYPAPKPGPPPQMPPELAGLIYDRLSEADLDIA